MRESAVDRVSIVAPNRTYVGEQGFTYGAGATAETVGATQICMNILPMASGARARVHFHRGIETIANLLEGTCSVYYGDEVEHRVVLKAGEQIFLPADVLHAPAKEARLRARGSWSTPPVAIRMGSFSNQNSMRLWANYGEIKAAQRLPVRAQSAPVPAMSELDLCAARKANVV